MRPLRSFLFFLIFLICFTGLYFLLHRYFGRPGIETIVSQELKAVISQLFTKQVPEQVIIAGGNKEFNPAHTKIRTDSVQKITFQKSSAPLGYYIDSINYSRGRVRIMYYGDSQIEGDRITAYLRHVLRENRQGTGPGLFLPIMPVTYTQSVWIRASSNWKRYNYLSFRDGEINHNDLGPFMAFCRYLPDGSGSQGTVKAWIRIVPSKLADKASASYENLRILYKNRISPVRIDVRAGNFTVRSDTLPVTQELREFTCPLFEGRNILIDFSGHASPDIYGISIESNKGVIVDNIPQRGSAGLEFTMVDRENLRESFRLLAPDLIVLHYGLNLVKNLKGNYLQYEMGLQRQLRFLHNVCPRSRIIVIGLTDMALAEGDVIRSYPNIPSIIRAQEKAASATGSMFWNAFEVMGGNSSIIRWAEMVPPLAKPDYVHFTDQGADTLSKFLYSELFFSPADTMIVVESAETAVRVADSTASEIIVTGGDPVGEVPDPLIALIKSVFRYNADRPVIFTAPAFWIFFLLVLVGYSFVYRKPFKRNLYLFLISLFFYYKTGGLFLLLLLLVTFIDYSAGLLIYRARSSSTRKIFLLISIITNIGILAYFKYTTFFTESFNGIFGTHIVAYDFLGAFSNAHLGTSFDVSNIILPVGISFFTFQSLSYTIDLYRRKFEPVRNIVDFGFYVSFFPQLVAGPIVRASEFIPQLYSNFQLTQREFSHAVFLISKGLIKKIIISDFIAVNFVDKVFGLPALHSGFENLMAVYGYGLQIYCDFSGYTDIAIGLGLILGFRLPLNFNSPYKASGISDFWKRWHISLSRWLKDFLYIPLGGNRKGKLRTVCNLMITMVLGGLWHGANLRFIIWGGLHGAGLVIDRFRKYLFGSTEEQSGFVRVLTIFLTFNFVNFCWIFFRAEDMHNVRLMLRQIVMHFSPGSYTDIIFTYAAVFLLMVSGYILHFLPERVKESYRGLFIRIPLAVQFAIILVIAIAIYQMRAPSGVMPFIYFRF